jgi:ABC-2 type transport system permease protein
MIGYVYIFIILVFISIFFMYTNLFGSEQGSFPYFASALSNMLIILVFAVPILTMKSIAEERHAKTDQLLLTYPVKVSTVILGKYFAMVTVYAIPLIISCLAPLVISWESAGGGSFLIDYSMILAMLCMGCLFVSIGMFISSLTESQIIAAITTMGAFLLLFFWSALTNSVPETAAATLVGFFIILAIILIVLQNLTKSSMTTAIVGIAVAGGLAACYFIDKPILNGLLKKFLGIFSITDTLSNFSSYYAFDLKGLLLFVSLSVLFVFLTVQSVQKRRWS